MKITQCEMIEDYLDTYGEITPLEAMRDLGIYRLASRICQMKKSGLKIKSEMVSVETRNGGRTHIATRHNPRGQPPPQSWTVPDAPKRYWSRWRSDPPDA